MKFPIRNTNFNSFTECDHAISPNAPSTSKHIDLNVPSDLRAYNVLLNIVTKPKRQEDLKSVSPHYATSALESFHSLALYYLPKEKFYDHDSYVLRSKLAILHWNSLRLEELEGTRTIKSQIPFWCKTKKQIVFKNRKTEGRHDWRKTIVELVLNSEATTSPHHNQQQSEIDARADAESRMYQS
ncbi:hypothetical protein CAEBREN_28539 [Caenorhabditis brenneri]|uniref:Uncharacterized protein n=1 Tax=Caenorhabditis brenneri TaxID=135651 RepID=G0N606_CAEBE|nr:hypothetical protein CAEBREN_28539 [Caenorhabditis brenneri]